VTYRPDDAEGLRRRTALVWRAAVHELNTPLSVLVNITAELSEALPGRPDVREPLATMRRELARLVAVVEDLSLRNELESGTLVCSAEPLAVGSLLVELMRAAEAQYPERIVVAQGFDDDLPPVLANADHLQFVLWTLLQNAARYSSTLFTTLTLKIVRGADGRSLSFRVLDDGTALLPEYGELVFEPLPDLPQALHRPMLGLGTGLYAARELARRMGGDLWIEPPATCGGPAGTGNVFVLQLPAVPTGGPELEGTGGHD